MHSHVYSMLILCPHPFFVCVQQRIVGKNPTFFHRHVSHEHQLPVTLGQHHAEAAGRQR